MTRCGGRAEVVRRVEQRRVDPLQRDVQRQDHQRQVAVDDADRHAERREQQVQAVVADEPERLQQVARAAPRRR